MQFGGPTKKEQLLGDNYKYSEIHETFNEMLISKISSMQQMIQLEINLT
jgi:hypothetical protein